MLRWPCSAFWLSIVLDREGGFERNPAPCPSLRCPYECPWLECDSCEWALSPELCRCGWCGYRPPCAPSVSLISHAHSRGTDQQRHSPLSAPPHPYPCKLNSQLSNSVLSIHVNILYLMTLNAVIIPFSPSPNPTTPRHRPRRHSPPWPFQLHSPPPPDNRRPHRFLRSPRTSSSSQHRPGSSVAPNSFPSVYGPRKHSTANQTRTPGMRHLSSCLSEPLNLLFLSC